MRVVIRCAGAVLGAPHLSGTCPATARPTILGPEVGAGRGSGQAGAVKVSVCEGVEETPAVSTATTYTVFVLPGENVSCQVRVLASDTLVVGTPFWSSMYRAIGKSPGTEGDH